jgi:hypothetical protein
MRGLPLKTCQTLPAASICHESCDECSCEERLTGIGLSTSAGPATARRGSDLLELALDGFLGLACGALAGRAFPGRALASGSLAASRALAALPI